MANSIFNIDYPKLLESLIPPGLRKPRLAALLTALTMPVRSLYGNFQNNRRINLYKLAHTGQVFSIRKVLNDSFDNTERRIYITDNLTKQRRYLFTRIENRPTPLNKTYIYNRSDYSDSGVDFIVWIPTQVFLSPQDLIRAYAMVDFYKEASKRFKIYRA